MLREVGNAGERAALSLATMSTKTVEAGAALSAMLVSGAGTAQIIGAVAPAATLAIPAVLSLAQGMGVLKLALGNMKQDWPDLYNQLQTVKKGLQETARDGISDGLHAALKSLAADLPVLKAWA